MKASLISSEYDADDFLQSFSRECADSPSPLKLAYTQENPSFLPALNFSVQNLRFASVGTPKPQVIVTPTDESHVRGAIFAAKKHGLEIRIRSGGHDYEGLSYVSQSPFIVLDLCNLRSITVDVESATAWVQSGATLGELCYSIAEKTETLSFPIGLGPSIGVGGFITGGGFGPLTRKYGLAADNVADAVFMDVNGKIRDRESMGEDLFWAIRGGGGGNFGVILAWKLKLVEIPKKVTVFTIHKTLEQNAQILAHQWQSIAPKFHKDLYIHIKFQRVIKNQNTTIQVSFQSFYLGEIDTLIPMLEESFPELGLLKDDCKEMNWIEANLYCSGYNIHEPIDVLLNRSTRAKACIKVKSDFISEPISEQGIKRICDLLEEREPGAAALYWFPAGGIMSEIQESEIPFPHRDGVLFDAYTSANWHGEGAEESEKALRWIRKLHDYMTAHVSKNPRASYVNHRDLDLGITNKNTTPEEARAWGVRYFKGNYERLVQVKTQVDPDNFFRNEQSIPPLPLIRE